MFLGRRKYRAAVMVEQSTAAHPKKFFRE